MLTGTDVGAPVGVTAARTRLFYENTLVWEVQIYSVAVDKKHNIPEN